MITTNPNSDLSSDDEQEAPFCVLLARYGAIPQVARFAVSADQFQQSGGQLCHGVDVVVETDRGPEVASLLDVVRTEIQPETGEVTGSFTRIAADTDREQHRRNRSRADVEFFEWQQRLDEWQLQLQLVDVEWTLDQEKVVLYVLNGQDAETTRLALLAAAAGLGIIHVQPVAAEGVIYSSQGGGCGSGGCSSGGCGH